MTKSPGLSCLSNKYDNVISVSQLIVELIRDYRHVRAHNIPTPNRTFKPHISSMSNILYVQILIYLL